MAVTDFNADPKENVPTLPAESKQRQPDPSASTIPTDSTQTKRVQSSIGACDACRLRKVVDLI